MRSESSEYVWKKGFLHKHFQNQKNFGDLFLKSMHRKVWEKLDESRDADYVVQHVSSKLD